MKQTQKNCKNKGYSIRIQVYSIQSKKNTAFYQSTATTVTFRGDLHMTSLPFANLMHLSMLSCRGGRPGIGEGFELRSFFLSKCPTPGTLSLVKRVQIPHPPPLPEKGQGIGQTRIKIGIYRNYSCKKQEATTSKCNVRLIEKCHVIYLESI